MRALVYIVIGLLGAGILAGVSFALATQLGIPEAAGPFGFVLGLPWGVYLSWSWINGQGDG